MDRAGAYTTYVNIRVTLIAFYFVHCVAAAVAAVAVLIRTIPSYQTRTLYFIDFS